MKMSIRVTKKKGAGGGDETVYEHDSFGLMSFSRISSNMGSPLFGSSIKHRNTIRMQVKRGSVSRHLASDWYHDDQGPDIVEVEMSYTQFAEAVSAMNCGVGVPVTLMRVNGKRMPPCEMISKIGEFSDEFKNSLQEVASRADDTLILLQEKIDKGKAGKGELQDILNEVKMLKQHIASNIPFVEKQFQKQVDRSLMEAKGAIDAHITHVVHTTGLKAIKNGDYKIEGLIENKT
jgi:hypothetical protein